MPGRSSVQIRPRRLPSVDMIRHFIFIAVVLLGFSTHPAIAHGDLHEVIDGVTKAIADTPDNAALFLRRAELYRLHHDWAAAEADYGHAIRLQPELSVVKLGLAQVRLAQGRERAGLQLLDDFLVSTPAHPGARALRADILERRGDWQKADADLAVAVASSPESFYATKRSELLERHGRTDAAVRCLDEASRRHGRVPVLDQRAIAIEERAGHIDGALKRVEDLIAKEPRPDVWLARKAQLLAKSGRMAEAQAAWQEAGAAFAKVPANMRGMAANCKLAAEIRAGLETKNGGGQ